MVDEARILVVDDEPAIVDLLATGLRFAGFTVATAGSGERALHEIGDGDFDLVLLDVMMPGMDGFTVLQRLRGAGCAIPVLFLTARADTEHRVRGLTLGGDDYIAKPFSLREVVARVRTVLRRTGPEPGRGGRLSFAGIELDEESHEVTRDGEPVALSPTEFRLLRYFLLNPGRVLSKSQILDQVWTDYEGEPGVVESYVSYLRRKLDSREPRLLHTVRGVGYVLRRPATASRR